MTKGNNWVDTQFGMVKEYIRVHRRYSRDSGIHQAVSREEAGPKTIYWAAGLLSLFIRLYFNFSQDLIPGINGGYYPLQVRSILETGVMGFSDMPLLFYLDAILIKITTLFGIPLTGSLIIAVVKIIDSLSVPLLLIPLYKLIRVTIRQPSLIFEIGIVSFTVLSFSPLVLTSDLQKNALAITFLLFSISWFLSFLGEEKKEARLLAALFFILAGLTHFGTFSFGLAFLLLFLIFYYKKKALLPLTLVLISGFGLIAIFDITRLKRLLDAGSIMFSEPSLFNQALALPDLINIALSVVLAIAGITLLVKQGARMAATNKSVVLASILALMILICPLLNGEYFVRLSLFLFIPQILLVIQIIAHAKPAIDKHAGISLMLLTVMSLFMVAGRPKTPVLSEEALDNLKELGSAISPDKGTIIIARHGLEWWSAWILHVKVAQDKAIDSEMFSKYNNILFLTQLKGFVSDGKRGPFHEPLIPPNALMVSSNSYFQIHKWIDPQ